MKTTATNLSIFRKAPVFQNLSDNDLIRIAEAAHLRKIQSGEFYFFQGDPAERIYLLLEGQLKMTQSSPDGQQVLMRVISTGMLFGAVALAQAEVYPVSAQAALDCSAVYWSKTELMEFVLQIPQLAMNTLRMMAEYVQEYQDRLRQSATERVERRLARALLRLASQSGRRVEEGVLIDLPLSRQDLAEMIGATLFTVSRFLSQWESHGLVVLGRERVIIRYPHGLVNIAEDLTP